MAAADVPTAQVLDEPAVPCVVKADGLAAGKGVWVCRTQGELDAALAAAQAFDGPLVLEELLEGEELSVFALTDGDRTIPLGAARDHKRAGDGDTGPNTGGMGAFSPVPGFGAAEVEELVERIHRPVLEQLARRASPFVGTLYAGLMLTADGPRVLEFNCRFGDPETQSMLPLLEGDLLGAFAAAAAGNLGGTQLHAAPGATVTVIEAAEAAGAIVFHAGTARRDDTLVTNGGRILGVTGVADDLERARAIAYEGAAAISFPGARYRTDIALRQATRVG